jgi:hypothetical protein
MDTIEANCIVVQNIYLVESMVKEVKLLEWTQLTGIVRLYTKVH